MQKSADGAFFFFFEPLKLRFLASVPGTAKKGVEKEYKVYFAEIRDSELRHTFFCESQDHFSEPK